ncbi:hypothetical protein DL771_008247 [Monosporascus sp. 5C6A]|nr:hypothetical protein DL771_008247 [Monosporascus sp. 5C6A]
MSPPKVLLTAATGYIGGTILHQLVTSEAQSLRDLSISLLVRAEDNTAKLKDKYGDRIIYDRPAHLDDPHQRVLQHLGPDRSRGRRTRTPPGGGGGGVDNAKVEGVYEFEEAENARERYPQRASELLVLDTSLEVVVALSIQASSVYGAGEGLFQGAALMNPIITGYVLARGHGFALGYGTGVISYVHVSGLAALYVRCMRRVVEDGGCDLPRSRAGIVFPINGCTTMQNIAWRCIDAAFDSGVLPRNDEGPRDREVRTMDLDVAEVGSAGHRLTQGTVARKLGWEPTRGEKAWTQDFGNKLRAALAGKRGVTIGNCINEAAGDP